MRVGRSIGMGAAAAFVLATSLGFGLMPPESAQALVAPPALPVSPSSLLAALETTGGLSAAEAASAAGGGVAATAGVAGTVGGVAVAGVGAFVATAGGIGVLTRATGGDTTYLCATGVALAALYGQNCTGYNTLRVDPNPNSDTSLFASKCDSKSKCMALNGIVYFGTTAYWRVTTTGISYDTSGNPTAATFSQAFLMADYPSGNQTSLSPVQGKYLNSQFGTTAFTATATYAPGAQASAGDTHRCLGGSGRTTAQDTAWNQCLTRAVNGQTDATTTNPQRFYKTTVRYSDGTSATAQSATFTESDPTLPQWPKVTTPSSSNGVAAEVIVEEWLTDLSASKVIYDQVTTSAYQNLLGQYPSCATGNCTLRIQVDHQDCVVGGSALCQAWFTNTNPVPTGHTIQCLWGSFVLAIAECNVIANYYKPDAQTAGKQYTDPQTGAAPAGDPQTGPKVDSSAPSASATPTATAQPSATPTPTSTPTQAAGGITTDPSSKDCLGNAVTGNPVTWVTGPVQCALQWAFVPDPVALKTSAAGVTTSWSQTAPVQVVNGVTGFVATMPQGTSGCSGITVVFPAILGGKALPLNVLNACSGPLATAATVARLILDVSLGIWALLTLTRFAGGVIGFGGLGKNGDGT